MTERSVKLEGRFAIPVSEHGHECQFREAGSECRGPVEFDPRLGGYVCAVHWKRGPVVSKGAARV